MGESEPLANNVSISFMLELMRDWRGFTWVLVRPVELKVGSFCHP